MKSVREEIKESNERKVNKMFEMSEGLIAYTGKLNTNENYTVTTNVTSADVSSFPNDYISASVNSKKFIGTFSNEEDAINAAKTKDMSKAETLVQYKYPAAGTNVIINIR